MGPGGGNGPFSLGRSCTRDLWAVNAQMPAQQSEAGLRAPCGVERAASIAFPEDQGPPCCPPLLTLEGTGPNGVPLSSCRLMRALMQREASYKEY